MDPDKADRYVKRSQLILGMILVIVVGLVALSGVGTLATSNVVTSVQGLSSNAISVGVDYSAFNPGPVALKPVKISVVVLTPTGVPLTTQAEGMIYVNSFGSSFGHLDFNMTLLPGALTTIQTLTKQGLGPLVSVKVDASFWGVVYSTITITSNMTLA